MTEPNGGSSPDRDSGDSGGSGRSGRPADRPRGRLAGAGWLQWLFGGIVVVALAVAAIGIVAAVRAGGGDDDPDSPGGGDEPGSAPEHVEEEVWTPTPRAALPDPDGDLPDPDEFSDQPRRGDSESEVELIDVEVGTGGGVETVTFSFAGDEVPPYYIEYDDAVRLYPDDEPIPMDGEAFLLIAFDLTDPNQNLELAFPPRIEAGQPQIAEVLLYDNLGGSLRFAVGVDNPAPFRVVDVTDSGRLVVEIETP